MQSFDWNTDKARPYMSVTDKKNTMNAQYAGQPAQSTV